MLPSLSWSPDGNYLAVANQYGSGSSAWNRARIWDIQAQELITELAGHSDLITSVAWSPDGSRIATSSIDQTAIIWDATTFEQLITINYEVPIEEIAWDSDNNRIATAIDFGVFIWDAITGERQ